MKKTLKILFTVAFVKNKYVKETIKLIKDS